MDQQKDTQKKWVIDQIKLKILLETKIGCTETITYWTYHEKKKGSVENRKRKNRRLK